MNPYETLGVDHQADPETVKRAYRKLAMEHHPDRKRGNAEKFHAVQKSYEILSDPERRARFDKHGEDGDRPDPQQVALSTIAGLLLQVIDKGDVAHTDIPSVIAGHIQAQIAALAAKRKETAGLIKKREAALKRFKRKSAGPNMMALMIEGDIRQKRAALEDIEREQETGAEILKILADYSYKTDEFTGHPFSSMVFR